LSKKLKRVLTKDEVVEKVCLMFVRKHWRDFVMLAYFFKKTFPLAGAICTSLESEVEAEMLKHGYEYESTEITIAPPANADPTTLN
jgi:hypothetical protein